LGQPGQLLQRSFGPLALNRLVAVQLIELDPALVADLAAAQATRFDLLSSPRHWRLVIKHRRAVPCPAIPRQSGGTV
jgi:hypothetical protein